MYFVKKCVKRVKVIYGVLNPGSVRNLVLPLVPKPSMTQYPQVRTTNNVEVLIFKLYFFLCKSLNIYHYI